MRDHVTVVFPGRRYGPDMPVLRFPIQGLEQLGAQVEVVQYPDYMHSTERLLDSQWDEAISLIGGAVAKLVEGFPRVTLLAKSLGTRVIARLPDHVLPEDVDAVWLTPIFSDPVTARAAAAKSWRSLYVYGTADPACDDVVLRDIVSATGGRVVAVPAGDHGLEVEGDVHASLAALTDVVQSVLRFTNRR